MKQKGLPEKYNHLKSKLLATKRSNAAKEYQKSKELKDIYTLKLYVYKKKIITEQNEKETS